MMCRIAAGVVVGDVVMVDFDGSTYVALTEYSDSRAEANVIVPTTVGIVAPSAAATPEVSQCWFAVVTDLLAGEAASGVTPGAENQPIKVCFRGRLKVKRPATASAVGAALYPTNAATTLTNVVTAGHKQVGIALEANSGAAGSYWTLFNGIEGWGNAIA